MGIVGNATDARLISEHARKMSDEGGTWWYEDETLLPEGWEFLGAGMYRMAFRSPDGVCYKVEKSPGYAYGQSNYEEFENYLRLVSSVQMPEGTRLPAYTFYKTGERENGYGRAVIYGISAMECINGRTLEDMHAEDEEGPDDWSVIRRLNRACRLSDIHEGNVMFDGDSYVLVDIGA